MEESFRRKSSSYHNGDDDWVISFAGCKEAAHHHHIYDSNSLTLPWIELTSTKSSLCLLLLLQAIRRRQRCRLHEFCFRWICMRNEFEICIEMEDGLVSRRPESSNKIKSCMARIFFQTSSFVLLASKLRFGSSSLTAMSMRFVMMLLLHITRCIESIFTRESDECS